MEIDFDSRSIGLLAVAVLIVGLLSGAAGLAAAGVTTTGDLAGDGTDTITDYNASSAENHTVTYETENTSGTLDDYDELSLEISHDNHTYVTYTQSDATVVSGDGDDTTVLEVEFTIEHEDLEKLPGDANEITTTDYTITEVEAGSDTETTTEFAVDYEFANTHAVRTAHSDDDAIATLNQDEGWFGFTSDSSVELQDDVGIDGANTTIHTYAEGDLTDEFEAAVDDNTEAGDRLGLLMQSSLDDEIVYVFYEEPGETVEGNEVDPAEDTYAVYHGNGHMEWNLADDRVDSDDNRVSLSAVGNDKFDRGALQQDLGYSWSQAWGLDLGSFSFDDLWLFMLGDDGTLFAAGAVASHRGHRLRLGA